jgi:hypothetical protein
MEEVVVSGGAIEGAGSGNGAEKSDWDHCRREARRLEGEIETKLVAYSKFSANYRQSTSDSALLLSSRSSLPPSSSLASSSSSADASSSAGAAGSSVSGGGGPDGAGVSPFASQEHINTTMSLEIEQCLERVGVFECFYLTLSGWVDGVCVCVCVCVRACVCMYVRSHTPGVLLPMDLVFCFHWNSFHVPSALPHAHTHSTTPWNFTF